MKSIDGFTHPNQQQLAAIMDINSARAARYCPPSRYFCFDQSGQFVASLDNGHLCPRLSLVKAFERNEHLGEPVLVDMYMKNPATS